MKSDLITLITDFGYQDPFVGIMKGIIIGINSQARIIDLSHGVPPQDLMAGALVLRSSVPFFPPGTIHVAVVDPGVGTKRRPLLIEAGGCFFIGPDNGVLSLALEGKEVEQIIELCDETYHLKPTSATFHGRDIFAPIAGYISLGIPAQDLGVQVNGFVRLSWPEVSRRDRFIQGEVTYIDGFGNLVTNISAQDLRGLNPETLTVSVGDLTIRGLAPNYVTGAEGGYIALINSWALLEISLFKRNAHLKSGIKIGEKVLIRKGPETP